MFLAMLAVEVRLVGERLADRGVAGSSLPRIRPGVSRMLGILLGIAAEVDAAAWRRRRRRGSGSGVPPSSHCRMRCV